MEVYAETTALVILDVPIGCTLSIDSMSFAATASFRGIKYIANGIHLLTYGLDKSELGLRIGFFFVGTPGTILAWKWDKQTEQLNRIQEQVEGIVLQERTIISHLQLTTGLRALHPYLTTIPPPEDGAKIAWADLTSFITVDILNRVLPPDWTFTSQTSSTNDESTDQLSSLPSSKSEAVLKFTSINLKRTFHPSAIGRERTDQILDKSYYLDTLLQGLPEDLALLGEFQLSFLTVLYMNNFSGFETWKNIFTVLCGCKAALRPREKLFRDFLGVLRQQFEMCSEETFNEVILGGDFVANNLKVPHLLGDQKLMAGIELKYSRA